MHSVLEWWRQKNNEILNYEVQGIDGCTLSLSNALHSWAADVLCANTDHLSADGCPPANIETSVLAGSYVARQH
jgi:hypothetical protein